MHRFYRLDPAATPSDVSLPAGYRFVTWNFQDDGAPRDWVPRWPNAIWWLFERARLFRGRGSGLVGVEHDGRLVARMLVSAGWYRFPAIVGDDLQIGDVWTDPAHRGRRLAGAMIGFVAQHWRAGSTRLWYIVDEANTPSIAVIERAGLRWRDGANGRDRWASASLASSGCATHPNGAPGARCRPGRCGPRCPARSRSRD